MAVIERVRKYLVYKKITRYRFYKDLGFSNGLLNKDGNLGSDKCEKILSYYRDINPQWLLTGEPPMLKSEIAPVQKLEDKNLIPFYDDVVTMGGMNSISATVDGHMSASEFIDAGDWFRDATAAIRHYGESMQEYPSGCILALKKINNKGMIVWGKNYCIETSDFRITKRLQHGDEHDTYVMAYSTNRETYPDGRLIHEPVKIPTAEISNLFLVLGCVIKEQSGGAVYIKQ